MTKRRTVSARLAPDVAEWWHKTKLPVRAREGWSHALEELMAPYVFVSDHGRVHYRPWALAIARFVTLTHGRPRSDRSEGVRWATLETDAVRALMRWCDQGDKHPVETVRRARAITSLVAVCADQEDWATVWRKLQLLMGETFAQESTKAPPVETESEFVRYPCTL